jgi:hypothetical protein
MSSVKEIGLFIDRRRCVECGRFCKVRLVEDNPSYLKSACCGALLRFAK